MFIGLGGNAAWSPPYSLPGVGQVVAIGTNNAISITPTEDGWTTADWQYSLFDSYGGGTFVEQWSAGGAYVLAGTGGHGHDDNPGAVLFDFADATWKRRDSTQAARSTGGIGFQDSALTGSPWWEITAASGNVPAPAHPYAQLCPLAEGTQGSVIYIGRSAVGGGANASPRIHKFNLQTRLWARQTTSALTAMSNGEVDAIYDAARNRYWMVPNNPHAYTYVEYLDAADWTVKSVSGLPFGSGSLSGAFRTFLHQGMLVRYCGAAGLFLFDPDVPGAGWINVTHSGTLPAESSSRFARFGSGAYYHLPTTGTMTLSRLTAPANPKTGTWVVSTVSLSGTALAAAQQVVTSHYTRLVYVPSINCMAWIPGWTDPVFLFRPE